MGDDARARAQQLALRYLGEGRFYEWFEQLYADSAGRAESIPWAKMRPNPQLAGWLSEQKAADSGKAAVAGCGLGDDAEFLAAAGHEVTAFDISPTAIEWCRQRFPSSSVQYVVADVLRPPADWEKRFGLVVDGYTIQSVTPEDQPQGMEALAGLLAPGGTLLVLCRGYPGDEAPKGPPWLLTAGQLEAYERLGLTRLSFDTEPFPDDPRQEKWFVVYQANR